jgi:DNA repair exonuclease SbcCD ATPase subunit
MQRKQTLKVFRTPIGFHDAYVAAPSQKAALEAWGSDADLFARGIAEQVKDPELTREPLERPGEVIRRSRGTAEEQIASLPKSKPRRRVAEEPEAAEEPEEETPAPKKRASRPAKTKPRPDRSALDQTEQAIAEVEQDYARVRAELARREEALRRERKEAERKYDQVRAKLEAAAEKVREKYDRAMRAWRV